MAQTIETKVTGAVYQEKFAELAKQPAWLTPLRKAGIESFAAQGFPTLQHEDWRFTNIAAITKMPFQPAHETTTNGAETQALSTAVFTALSGSRLVFVDGFFSAKLSSIKPPAGGVKIKNLADALTSESALIEKHLGKYAVTKDNAFAALNQAFFADGAFIYVPAGVTVEEPVQLIYLSSAQQSGAAIHPRNLIIASYTAIKRK
ncbi:MAG: hypothetical protein ABJA70_20970 [Chryseolinea sp.]